MASPEWYHGKTTAVLKKAAAILTTTGFFAAAIVLAAVLWMPANAASTSPTIDVQTSMLLSLDTPQARATKINLRDLSQMTEENKDSASAAAAGLSDELNSWAYTAAPQNPLVTLILDIFVLELTILKGQAMFLSGIVQALGGDPSAFIPVINSLVNAITALLNGGQSPGVSAFH